MHTNNNNPEKHFDLSIKEALKTDAQNLKFITTVLVDPAPLPYVPLTPFLIGKKLQKQQKKQSTRSCTVDKNQ